MITAGKKTNIERNMKFYLKNIMKDIQWKSTLDMKNPVKKQAVAVEYSRRQVHITPVPRWIKFYQKYGFRAWISRLALNFKACWLLHLENPWINVFDMHFTSVYRVVFTYRKYNNNQPTNQISKQIKEVSDEGLWGFPSESLSFKGIRMLYHLAENPSGLLLGVHCCL